MNITLKIPGDAFLSIASNEVPSTVVLGTLAKQPACLSELQFSDPKNGHNDNTYLAGLSRESNVKHIRNWHSVPDPWSCSGNGVLVILRVGVSIDCCVSAVKSFGEPVTSKRHRC